MNKTKKISNDNVSEDKIVLYTDKKGNVELRADIEKETLWATQEQIARLFEVDQSVASRHIRNIFRDGEVDEKSNMQKMHIANADRPIALYSLDIILAVGYRTNSKNAITFRKWSTKVLRNFLVRGFNLDGRKLAVSSEKLENLKEALAFMESESRGGPLKAKMYVRMSKNLLP